MENHFSKVFLFTIFFIWNSSLVAKDWSCARKNAFGSGLDAKVSLKENLDGTYKILWSQLLLGPADQTVANVRELQTADTAKCVFSGEYLVYCMQEKSGIASFPGGFQFDAYTSFYTTEQTERRLNAKAEITNRTYLNLQLSTNRTEENFDLLTKNQGFRFAIVQPSKAGDPSCGFE
jgi:hypothetical protein